MDKQKLIDECRAFLKTKIKESNELNCLVIGFGWNERKDQNDPLGIVVTDDEELDNIENLTALQAISLTEIASNLQHLASRGLISEVVRLVKLTHGVTDENRPK